MTDTRANIPSVVERTRPVDAGAPVVAAHFLGQTAVFVLGEEALLFMPRAGEPRRVSVHGGAILASAADKGRIVTGGDDGKVMATDAEGKSIVLATDAKHRWIDHVAVGPGGAVAWSAGKEAFVRTEKGAERMLAVPSTAGGLAFASKGLRVAVTHYNGVTLWFVNAQSAPETLQWKGSHLDARMSPDGRFLITSMQEPSLHGWRLADRKDMRMSGYGARVRSLDFSVGGKWLATSGSTQLILCKPPRILAPAQVQADVVACHPKQEVVAVGYADGLALLVRIEDGAEVLARKGADAPIAALAWSASGAALAFGAEDGAAGVIDLG